MKKNNSILIIVLAIVIVVIGFYLYNKGKTSEPKITKIGFLVPTLENPFFVDMTESAKSMDSENLQVLIQANQDELKQNQIIDNFITQGVNAICVVPINSESIIPAILKANKANIPIINVDNKINMESAKSQGAQITFYIGSDNFEGGQLAGKFITEKLHGKGKVAILEGVTGNDAAINRKAGFEDAIKNSPEIKVVASQAADWNRQKANDIFQAILTANPDLNAVFACNDEMALGAIAALKASGIPKDKIIVVGFDAIDEAVKAVADGQLDATIAQQPKLMGQKSIELVKELLEGKDIKKEYSTPLKVIQ